MSMLARYKKPGQIMELVKLIEESGEPKKSQLLNMVRGEDPEFAAEVESKILTYETIKKLDAGVLAEIVVATPAKHLSLALHGEEDAEFVSNVEKCLGNKFAEYKEEKTNFQSAPPEDAKVEAGRRKMISEARKLEKSGAIKLPKVEVNTMSPSGSASASSAASGGGADAPVVATYEGEGLPPMDAFGFEAPPPGMSGERFETFIKKLIT